MVIWLQVLAVYFIGVVTCKLVRESDRDKKEHQHLSINTNTEISVNT